MDRIILNIMYSDKIATIEDGVHEKKTLNNEINVANQVEKYLEKHFLKEKKLEEISILLLSYTNPPQLPPNLPFKKWKIKCESHTPYVQNLLNSIPLNCDLLQIEIDNGAFGEIADMEQVRTARDLVLKMSDEAMELGISEEQIGKFGAVKLRLGTDK